MSVNTLLRTKLYVPQLRPDFIPRQRLVDRLNEGVAHNCMLTLLSAPAGFGKTMLAAAWLQQLGHAGRAWINLDESDNDPARFFAYLLLALQSIDPQVGRQAQVMLSAPPTPFAALLASLVNDLAGSTKEFILVLDDYHLLESTAVHDSLRFLLRTGPPNLHLALTSRTDPPFPLARLRARSQINEIRQAELGFTAQESAEFLQQQRGFQLTAAEVKLLVTRSEGWIAGLQLATLALRSYLVHRPASEGVRFLQAFAGDDRYVLDYLSAEVLQQQPADVQLFLLKTSVLRRLNSELVEAVTGQENGQQMLDTLESSNLFIIPLDNRRSWFRYHHLFAGTLQLHLRARCDDRQIARLHGRAAAWYEENGAFAEAIDHAFAAEEFPLAARLVAQIADEAMYRSGEVVSLKRWLAALPEEVVQAEPQLLLARAWLALWTSNPQGARRQLSTLLDRPLPPDIQGQVAVLQAQLTGQSGRAAEAISRAEEALAVLPTDGRRLRGMALAASGAGYRELGQLPRAEADFSRAIVEFQTAGLLIPVVIMRTNQALALADQGKLREAQSQLQQTMTFAQTRQATELPVMGGAHIALGEVHYEFEQLTRAEEQFTHGIQLSGSWPGFAEETLQGHLGLARLCQAQGRDEHANKQLAAAESLARETSPAHWKIRIKICRANILLARRDLSAGSWDNLLLENAGLPLPLREQTELVLAHRLLYRNQPGEIGRRLEPLLEDAQAEKRVHSALAMRLLLAQSSFLQNRTERALLELGQVLATAEPHGYVRLFLDGGPYVVVLLKRATQERIAVSYVQTLLAAFGDRASPALALNDPAAVQLVEPLTAREREVLRLMSSGRSNPEIAQELVVAVSTVKSHAKNIYSKLNVTNRFQAIERARELNLI